MRLVLTVSPGSGARPDPRVNLDLPAKRDRQDRAEKWDRLDLLELEAKPEHLEMRVGNTLHDFRR